MRIPPVSGLGGSGWNSQSVCVILEARPCFPAEHTNTAAALKNTQLTWMWQKREGGSQEVCGGEKEIRAEPEIDVAPIQCWLSRLMLKDGLSVDSDFHSGVLDPTLAQVLPHIPGLFPLWLECELAGEAITVSGNAGLFILLLFISWIVWTAPSGKGFHGIFP